MNPKLRFAIYYLQREIGDGKLLSDFTAKQKKLIKVAEKFHYVNTTPTKSDFLVNNGRRIVV